ncbi:MAG: restriction endonuclease subunit S, partial [Hydrogenophaga sp.]|nr:restriction endonuclease subunit S [Hydrogenophaga sp.]
MTAERVRLGEAAELLVGFAFKSAQFLQPDESGIKLVRGDNVQQGYLRWGNKAMKWNADAFDDLARYQLQLDDVVLAMDRPIVGGGLKLAWVKESDLPSLLVQRVTRIRGLPGVADTTYLRYALSAPDFVAHIDRVTTGANIPHISGKDIAAFELRLPPLDQQLDVVEKLTAYDDLIENNRRRIALLEESARLLYREWFVHLRFPGHESSGLQDGLPTGWSWQ